MNEPRPCCINCAYIGTGNISHFNELQDLPRELNESFLFAGCYHNQWSVRLNGLTVDEGVEVLSQLENLGRSEFYTIDANEHVINLSQHSCHYFQPKEKRQLRSFEQFWREESQLKAEKKARRRFCINATLSAITALTLIATFLRTLG